MRSPLANTLAAMLLLAAFPTLADAETQRPSMLIDGLKAGSIALGRVCLPGILEARPIEDLAKAEGMTSMPPSSVGAGPNDRTWRLSLTEAVYAVAWADGSCTVIMQKGGKDDLRAMAESEILARPEGFARGSSAVIENNRLERTIYCAQTKTGWAVVSLTLPGPSADGRTRALSSTTYRRPTRSPLCG